MCRDLSEEKDESIKYPGTRKQQNNKTKNPTQKTNNLKVLRQNCWSRK